MILARGPNLEGQGFGRLTVVSYAGRTPAGQSLWNCRCSCGGEARTTTTKLRSGHTTSCDCVKREKVGQRRRTHGRTIPDNVASEYGCWAQMRRRCLRPNNVAYPAYGGRGITICESWLNGDGKRTAFECFLADMGPRPSKLHSLDRYPNNDGNYEPDNCRWAAKKFQARNRRSNRMVEVGGTRLCVAEACERLGLNHKIVNDRLWSFERAISQGIRGRA
jgi:hypothetical protein